MVNLSKEYSLMIGATLGLLTMPGNSLDLAIELGPFQLEIESLGYENAQLVCDAISRRKRMEMTFEVEISDKVMLKKIVLDPYLYGSKKKGCSFLRGMIVEEILLKETFVSPHPLEQKDSHVLTGQLKKVSFEKNKPLFQTVNIRHISAISVLNDSTFQVVKEISEDLLKTSSDERSICAL